MHNQQIIRPNELAKLLGVSRFTVYKYAAKPDFPAKISLSSGSVGWHVADIEAWIESKKAPK